MIFILRLAHILAGAFWFGALIFSARILMPAARETGPAAGPLMGPIARRLSPMMMGAAIVTIGAGIWLMFLVSGGAPGPWMQSGMGRTIGLGAALAIIAFIFGFLVNMPAGRRLGAISQGVTKRGGPPNAEESAEMAQIQKRLAMGTTVVAILIGLALAAMAVARYVP